MGFESCHPAVNLLFFASVISGTLAFRHPLFLGVSVGCAAAYSLKRSGLRALKLLLWLLPCVAVFTLYYACYHHFGVTVLTQNGIGNRITVEALVSGAILGFRGAGAVIWMSCVYSVFSSDKVVYLFGRVSPPLSLALSILLRMVPRIQAEARKIHTARKGLGKGIDQGSGLARVKNGLRILSVLISWLIESLATASDSMRSRGSSARGRTAFSVYRFDNRDRAYVTGLFACLTLTMMAALTGRTGMVCDPVIVWRPMERQDFAFLAGYAGLCLMPLLMELWMDSRFPKAAKHPLS